MYQPSSAAGGVATGQSCLDRPAHVECRIWIGAQRVICSCTDGASRRCWHDSPDTEPGRVSLGFRNHQRLNCIVLVRAVEWPSFMAWYAENTITRASSL